MGSAAVTTFLSWLAAECGVAPSTHKQALSALLFLYREVLEIDLPWMNEILRPKDRVRVPTVLSVGEVARLYAALQGPMALLGRLLYGTGLRLMEALRLRIKDVDFESREIVVSEPAASGRIPPTFVNSTSSPPHKLLQSHIHSHRQRI